MNSTINQIQYILIDMLGFKNKSRGIRRAKATVRRVLPSEIIVRTQKLLQQYGRMTLDQFVMAYLSHFKTILDATAIGFDDGVIGLFSELSDMVHLEELQDGTVLCSLRQDLQTKKHQTMPLGSYHENRLNALKEDTSSEKQRYAIPNQDNNQSHENILAQKPFASLVTNIDKYSRPGEIFNPDNQVLWSNQYKALLMRSMDSISIPKSPYELAQCLDPVRTERDSLYIRKHLSKYSNGLPLNQTYGLIKTSKYQSNSYATCAEQCPELFYIKYMPDDQEPVVFDGHLYNHEDFDFTFSITKSPSLIAFQSITSGIYQMTMLLVRKAEPDGLKVGVWRQSMIVNFPRAIDDINQIMNMPPLVFFLTLKEVGLIDLKPTKICKNDIRVHLPTGSARFIDVFMNICKQLKKEQDQPIPIENCN